MEQENKQGQEVPISTGAMVPAGVELTPKVMAKAKAATLAKLAAKEEKPKKPDKPKE
jgi:hypothetical protein